MKIAILAKIEFEAKNSKTIKINPIKECHSRNRKIAQYDINNNLIKIYTSKSEILNTLKIKKSMLKYRGFLS